MYAQSLRFIVQARQRDCMSITALVRQATVLLRPLPRLPKARLFNMLPLLVQTKVLITATNRGKLEPFSAAVDFGAVVRALACGAGMVALLRRARAASLVVAFAINPQYNFSAHPSAS